MEASTQEEARTFALTGGIGSGKSVVAEIWREMGLPIVDADQLARDVVEPGSAAHAAIVAEFGATILSEAGALDRAKLGSLVFSDEGARARLNAIVHPEVRRAAEEAFLRCAARGQKLICYVIPLLFETNQEARFRPVVVVSATQLQQMERVAARDALSPDEAAARLKAQIPLREKEKRADILIVNSGTLAELKRRAIVALEEVRAFIGK